MRKTICLTDSRAGFEKVDVPLTTRYVFIQDAFVHKKYFLSVFLGIEKAYDTTWHFGISRDLITRMLGLVGNLESTYLHSARKEVVVT